MRQLTDVQADIVGEIFNLGMGHAVRALSEMLAQEILLSVPAVELLERAEVRQRYFDQGLRRVTAVTQEFSGPFSGESFLIFSDAEGLRLATAMLGDETSPDEVGELAQEVLAEIGNIVLNACLGSVGNIFGEEIASGLPRLSLADCDSVLASCGEDSAVLFLQIDFAIQEQAIRGFVAFLVDVASTDEFCNRVDALAGAM